MQGMQPSSVILKKEVIQPDVTVRLQLNLEESKLVNHLLRLRLADGEPMAIESSYTPYDLFPDLLQFPWTINTSLYNLLREKYGYTLYYCKQKISSVSIDEQQSTLLQVPENSPGLAVEETVFSELNVPVEFSRNVYRGDRYEYNLTLPGGDSRGGRLSVIGSGGKLF